MIKKAGVKGLKLKKMKFWLPEALDNCLLDIVEQFD